MIHLNFMPEVNVETLKNLNLLIGCFFFAFTGAYLHELNKIYSGKQRATKIHKIVIGTIIGMGLYLVMTYKFIHDLNISIAVALNVVCGLLGYEIFNRCSSIEGLKDTSKDVGDIVKNLSIIGSAIDKWFGSDKEDDSNHHKK